MPNQIKVGDRVFHVPSSKKRACDVTTKQAEYRFTLKEGPFDPFIAAEPAGSEPPSERPLANEDLLCFQLSPGISLENAKRVADVLNEHILRISIMQLRDDADAFADLESENRDQVEGVVLEIVVDPFSGPSLRLSSAIVMPVGSMCLVPEGHVFEHDLGMSGEINQCSACGYEPIVPYRATDEEERDV